MVGETKRDLSQWEGERLLKDLDRKTAALRELKKSSRPSPWLFSFCVPAAMGLIVFSHDYFDDDHWERSAVSVLTLLMISLFFEMFKMRRRLDAAVDLLKLQEERPDGLRIK